MYLFDSHLSSVDEKKTVFFFFLFEHREKSVATKFISCVGQYPSTLNTSKYQSDDQKMAEN